MLACVHSEMQEKDLIIIYAAGINFFSLCFVARLHVSEFNVISFTSTILAIPLVWRGGKNGEGKGHRD